MTSYSLVISPRAKKYVDKMPKDQRDRIGKALLALRENPKLGKQLKGPFKGQRSYRRGDYRIIYRINEESKMIGVADITTRGGAYDT